MTARVNMLIYQRVTPPLSIWCWSNPYLSLSPPQFCLMFRRFRSPNLPMVQWIFPAEIQPETSVREPSWMGAALSGGSSSGCYGSAWEFVSGWWFGPFFIFHFICGMSSFPLTNIFQRGRSTTNQICLYRHFWLAKPWMGMYHGFI